MASALTTYMTSIKRFSSRRKRIDHAFLAERLRGAKSYKRTAGYFRSSIFELVGEEIAAIPKVQIVCNSELDAADVTVSKHARETALKERWNEVPAEVKKRGLSMAVSSSVNIMIPHIHWVRSFRNLSQMRSLVFVRDQGKAGCSGARISLRWTAKISRAP
jgi:hypothetical protein